MQIQSTNQWDFPKNLEIKTNQELKQIKDVVPELKKQQIKTDSVSFSKEGLEALRKQVQSMPKHTDLEEVKKIKEFLPKVSVDPAGEFLWAMRTEMQNSLNAIKQSKGSYNLDDLISIRMDAYTKQYEKLQKAYEDNARDVYIDDGIDENGKWQCHKVTWEEDVEYLNQAFSKIANGLGGSAVAWETQWKINEQFGGEEPLPVTLTENYDKKLTDILKRAATDYVEKKNAGQDENASALAIKYLNEDAEYANSMYVLFSNIKPMPWW